MLTRILLASISGAAVVGPSSSPSPDRAPIVVQDLFAFCGGGSWSRYEWESDGDSYRSSWRRIDAAEFARIRSVIANAPKEGVNLLEEIGFTRATLAAHHAQILDTAWPEEIPRPNPFVLPPELEFLLDYDRLAQHVLKELLRPNGTSTRTPELAIDLPGEPGIHVETMGQNAFLLPWKVRVGDKTWISSDIEVSRAVLALVDPQGACHFLLDGANYWRTEFWSDYFFWSTFVGNDLETRLVPDAHTRVGGYEQAQHRFRVDRSRVGSFEGVPDALFVELTALRPGDVDAARWWSPLLTGLPSANWMQFLEAFDKASRAVERQSWLREWKAAGPGRSIEAQIVGDVPYADPEAEVFGLDPWEDAHLVGVPEIEIVLRRQGAACGTVWLSSKDPAAIIEAARSGPGEHWFDALDFAFQPTQPEYGLVDAAGHFSARRIAKERAK